MSHAIFACKYGGWRTQRFVSSILTSVLVLVASPLCFAIDLVSTNALGQQALNTGNPSSIAISNDGNTVLFLGEDTTLVPGTRGNFYVKRMSTGNIVPVLKRPDGLPITRGFTSLFAYMNEPPTRVVFGTIEGDLGPGIGGPGFKILRTEIGSYQYLPIRGIPGGPAMQFNGFAANSRLDRIYLQTLGPLPVPSNALYQLAEVSATLPTPPIIHTLRPDGTPSQTGVGGEPEREPNMSASGDGRILAWWDTNFDVDPKGNEGLVTGQIFIRDTQLGVTRQVRADNGDNLHFTELPSVSDDGSFVTFWTDSYFTGPCNGDGIYGIDTRTWQRECISVNTAGEPANSGSYQSDVSADGNRVVFSSLAQNLGPNFPGLIYLEFGVFVRDRRLGRTVRVDINAQGIPANGRFQDPFEVTTNRDPRISKNGRWVIFTSDASNLVPNDTNGHEEDIFRVDLNRFLPDPSLGAAPLVPVPALSMLASLVLILAMLGFGVWRCGD